MDDLMPIPIPTRPCGYRLGSGNAPVQVEAFVDIECPFSKKAWPTLLDVVNNYGDTQVSVTLYPTFLSDHRQSWDVTKAAIIMADDDPVEFWRSFSYLYQHQSEFANEAFDDKTRQDLYQLLADYATDFMENCDRNRFLQQISSDTDEIASRAKEPFRYAIQRGIWSTPTFLINGAESTQLSSASTIADWQHQIDHLL